MWHGLSNKCNSILIQYLRRNWALIVVFFGKSHIEMASPEFWTFEWEKKVLKEEIESYLRQTSNFLLNFKDEPASDC